MGKRLLAILVVMAALGLGTPSLMADHGEKGRKAQHGNKHVDNDNDKGWERRDGYEFRAYDRDSRPQDGVAVRKPDGVTADCLQAKPRSTAVGLTSIRVAPIITIRTTMGGSSSAVPPLPFMAARTLFIEFMFPQLRTADLIVRSTDVRACSGPRVGDLAGIPLAARYFILVAVTFISCGADFHDRSNTT